jgi:two-component system OmpR family response regulator
MARVLVVDDDPDLRMLIHMLIVRLGHEVVAACDGEEALAVLLDNGIDLLVVDNMMPKVSGAEVVAAVRTAPRSTRLPIIMVSAHRPGDADVDVSLPKPFSLRILADHVGRLLAAA